MYNYIIIIIILLVLLLVTALNKSENKKMRLIGWGLLIFAIMAYAFSQFGVAFILNPVFSIILIGIIFGIFLVVYKNFRNIKYQKESYEDIEYLNRDISTEYPPSVVGYLINNRLKYKDLIADIMELYAEKIIDISKSNEQGEKKTNFYLADKVYRSKVKSKSYIYIIDTLIDDTKNEKFDFKTWKQLVIEEYEIREFAIYESYIPYAIVLDVNVQYKNTKFDIFDEEEFQSIMNENDCANFLKSMGINM